MNRLFMTCWLLLSTLASQSAMAKEWVFDVYLDKSKIGQHTFKLNDALVLTSTATFKVKVLFINAYQYEHQAIEQWQDDCLTSLDAHTTENKVNTYVKGKLSSKNFIVETVKSKQELPVCTMTFAYWNSKIIEQSKLLNPQNAEWLETKFTKIGVETIDVKNQKIDAIHYKLDGSLAGKTKLNIDLWYTNNNEWVGLKSITPEGYTIHYKLR